MSGLWHRLDLGGAAMFGMAMDGAEAARAAPWPQSFPASDDGFSVELRPLISCRAIMAEWHELAARAIEPNVFSSPDIMLAAAQHLPARQPPAALLVRSGRGTDGRLLALLPLETARMPLLPDAARAYSTLHHPVGVPLVDREQAVEALTAILNWLESHGHGLAGFKGQALGISGLLLPRIPLEGAFAQALQEAARAGNRTVSILGQSGRPLWQRQPLATEGSTTARMDPARAASVRHLMESRRRDLSGLGTLRIEESASGQTLRDAIENFMLLEASSHERTRRRAMVQNPRTVCFMRSATRMLGRAGHCRVLTLHAGELPVAAAIMLESGGRSWIYQTASDARLNQLSPELVLMGELRRRQLARKLGHVTDSCMDMPDPALDALWSGTAPFGDLLVASAPGNSPGSVAMRMREAMRRRLREAGRQAYRTAFGPTR
jgi:CelD/BcsL family acetyltransferase involved in cellulose biosynthesis